jgi:integrase
MYNPVRFLTAGGRGVYGVVSTTKSGRMRYIPTTVRLAWALGDHRHLRGPRVVCQDDGTPLARQQVQYWVKCAARTAKVKDDVHILRHTFAPGDAWRSGTGIQEVAGHREITMTQRYMHVSPAAIDGAIRLLDRPASSVARGGIVATAGA